MDKQSNEPSFLEFLPVSFFGMVMALCGLSFSWGWAAKLWHFPAWPKQVAEVLTLVCFVLLTVVYISKWIKYPALVKTEFDNPVSVSFFATFIICLLLIPGIILPFSAEVAVFMWCTGAALIFIFAWIVLRKWLDNTQAPGNALPAWIIPIVGTLDAPIVGYRLPITGIHEICTMFFGIGLVFAIILMTIIISRLLFQASLPEALQPTLLILVGPFALAYSGYISVTGSADMVSSVFYYFDLFLLLIFLSKIILLPKCCPFRVTWWAVGFPMAAITIASLRYAANRTSTAYYIVPALLLGFSTLVIIYLLCQTIYRFSTRQLLLPNVHNEKATTTMQGLQTK